MAQLCYACDSTTTRIVSGKHPNWALNRPTDLVLCDNCYRSIVYYPTYRTIKKAYSRRYYYKNRVDVSEKAKIRHRHPQTKKDQIRNFNLRIKTKWDKCSNCGLEIDKGINQTYIISNEHEL
jgi:hypothetical protein